MLLRLNVAFVSNTYLKSDKTTSIAVFIFCIIKDNHLIKTEEMSDFLIENTCISVH